MMVMLRIEGGEPPFATLTPSLRKARGSRSFGATHRILSPSFLRRQESRAIV